MIRAIRAAIGLGSGPSGGRDTNSTNAHESVWERCFVTIRAIRVATERQFLHQGRDGREGASDIWFPTGWLMRCLGTCRAEAGT